MATRMADKHDYDEDGYQFTDPESQNPMDEDPLSGSGYYEDPLRNQSTDDDVPSHAAYQGRETGKKNVLRNAIIVILLILFFMLAYTYLLPLFKKEPDIIPAKKTETPAPVTKMEPAPEVKPEYVAPPPPQSLNNVDEKLNNLDQGQQSVRMEMNTLTSQLSSIQNNMSTLSAQLGRQNEMLTQLSQTVTEQAQIIAMLNARLQEAKKPAPSVVSKPRIKKILIHYFLKAIVPGRAWLVASNGSTLTVREGTSIPGYGVVKLIDAQQGRVVMRSGRVIRFSPDDS